MPRLQWINNYTYQTDLETNAQIQNLSHLTRR